MPIDPRTGLFIPGPGEPGYMGPPGQAFPARTPPVAATPVMQSGGGQFTPEQNAYMMENMPAVTQQETENARAQALSDSLRSHALSPDRGKRMDWGSQAARAITGIASAYQNKKMMEGGKSLDVAKKGYYGGLADLMRGGKKRGGSGIDYARDDPDNFMFGQN